VPSVNGSAGDTPLFIAASAGQTVNLNASASTDPDGDNLSFNWVHYAEISTYSGSITISGSNTASASVTLPGDFGQTDTVHLYVEVKDDGLPNLTRYKRVIIYRPDIVDNTPPGTPTNLEAVPQSESAVSLSWAAAGDAESGIACYNIYRDNQKVGTAQGLSYTDSLLTEGTEYQYQVSALNGAQAEGARTAAVTVTTMADQTLPALVQVHASGDPTSVTVVFSEPVEGLSAQNPANYAIDNGITVSAAQSGPNDMTIVLTTSTLSENVTYTLTVNNVRDRASAPNTIENNAQAIFSYVAELNITGLAVSTGKAYAWDTLAVGKDVYIDRNYTFSSVPTTCQGRLYLQTANDDKAAVSDSLIVFETNQAVTVYVGYTGTAVPAWLLGWTATGEVIQTTDRNMTVYAREFPAGTVVLGDNGGASSMYSVVVKKAGGPTVETGDAGNADDTDIGLSVRPNPFNPCAQVIFRARAGKAGIRIIDVRGSVVVSRTVHTRQGYNRIPVDLAGQPSGVYVVEVLKGNKRFAAYASLIR
jgi:hypothetical protein